MSAEFEHQDWQTVVIRKRSSKKDALKNSPTSVQVRDSERNEKVRLAKLDMMDYTEVPKKRIHPESIQSLIRRRMELKFNQEKADQLCNFPRHTFKNIESNRVLPTQLQQSLIQKHFSIQLKIEYY
jgi:DNA-binding XRE family transcriptional regulator